MSPERAKRTWLTTFTDLTALMLTFFVLQFSMSRIDEVQWQNLSDSFQHRLSRLHETQVPLPRETLGISAPDQIPGDDLSYLESVLREHLEKAGLADRTALEMRGDRLAIHLLGQGGERDGSDDTVLRATAGLVARLENEVEILVRIPAAAQREDARTTVREGLARALQAEARLAAFGARDIGFLRVRTNPPDENPPGVEGPSQSDGPVPGIGFIVHPHAGERR
jgi:chemotaxis protein MotB